MEIPVFCRISTGIHPPADQLLPHLLASSRESPTGDLDPLCSAINLRILYGTEKRFKKMFDCLGGLAMTRIVFNSLRDVLSPFLNVSQESQPRAKCLGKSKTWSCPVLFCYGGDSFHLETAGIRLILNWGIGSEGLVMTPYTVADGSTEEHQWYNFVHSSTRFLLRRYTGNRKTDPDVLYTA